MAQWTRPPSALLDKGCCLNVELLDQIFSSPVVYGWVSNDVMDGSPLMGLSVGDRESTQA
jgi:hypothetical protein